MALGICRNESLIESSEVLPGTHYRKTQTHVKSVLRKHPCARNPVIKPPTAGFTLELVIQELRGEARDWAFLTSLQAGLVPQVQALCLENH